VVLAVADPKKPTWPTEFDSPFSLYSLFSWLQLSVLSFRCSFLFAGLTNLVPNSPILNATSHFYYSWDNLQAQVIGSCPLFFSLSAFVFSFVRLLMHSFFLLSALLDYPSQCIPVLPNGSTKPCKLYFNPVGAFVFDLLLNNLPSFPLVFLSFYL
jgi:hypothetical protein